MLFYVQSELCCFILLQGSIKLTCDSDDSARRCIWFNEYTIYILGMSLSFATMPVKSPGQARLISATAAARKNLHCGKTPDKALCVEDYDDGAGNAGAGSGEDKDEQEHDDGNSVFSLLVGCSGENCSERCVKLLSCWFINVSSIPISARKFWSQHSRAFAKKWLGQRNQKEKMLQLRSVYFGIMVFF